MSAPVPRAIFAPLGLAIQRLQSRFGEVGHFLRGTAITRCFFDNGPSTADQVLR